MDLTCEYCGETFEKRGARGPTPKFCKPTHRRRAHEKRHGLRRSMAELNDPMTALQEGASQLHELFLAWTNSGFTEQQALYLIAQMIVGSNPNEGP